MISKSYLKNYLTGKDYLIYGFGLVSNMKLVDKILYSGCLKISVNKKNLFILPIFVIPHTIVASVDDKIVLKKFRGTRKIMYRSPVPIHIRDTDKICIEIIHDPIIACNEIYINNLKIAVNLYIKGGY